MRDNINQVAPFTLDLSKPTIRLLYNLYGAPTVIGDITIADRLVPDKLERLRSLANRLCSEPLLTTVIVPSEHVMFRMIPPRTKAKTPMEAAITYLSQDQQLDLNELYIDAFTDGTDYFFAAIKWKTLQEVREGTWLYCQSIHGKSAEVQFSQTAIISMESAAVEASGCLAIWRPSVPTRPRKSPLTLPGARIHPCCSTKLTLVHFASCVSSDVDCCGHVICAPLRRCSLTCRRGAECPHVRRAMLQHISP